MVRRRGTLPAHHDTYAYVGDEGQTAPAALKTWPREDRLLRGGEPKNRATVCTVRLYVQRPDMRNLSGCVHGPTGFRDNKSEDRYDCRQRKLAQTCDAGTYGKAAREIVVLYLPPYSPDLNVIERVWRLTRRICTHNKYFDQLDDMAATLMGFFMNQAEPNGTFRSLCAIN